MARRAELPTFAGERQQILVPAIFTTDPGKSHMEITAIQIFIDYRHDICPPESIPGFIHVIPSTF